MNNNIVLFAVSFAFVVGLSLTGVNAISPFTEIGNLEAEVLDAFNQVGDLINTLNATQMTQQVQIDSLITIQISELVEQDGIQVNIINLQGNVTTATTQIDVNVNDIDQLQINVNDLETQIFSNIQFFTNLVKIHPVGFHAGQVGNASSTILMRYTAYEDVDVTVDFQYLESSRRFNNGTEKSFQLLDDVVLLGESKIFIETFIVPLGDNGGLPLPSQIISSCLILPGDDPAICNKTTTLAPGEDIQVFFKTDIGGFITGLDIQTVNTKVTTLVTPISP